MRKVADEVISIGRKFGGFVKLGRKIVIIIFPKFPVSGPVTPKTLIKLEVQKNVQFPKLIKSSVGSEECDAFF